MASIKLYFDKRVNRKDGKFPLKINVTHKRQQALINLGVLLSPDQWDSTKGKVVNGSNKSFLNGYISQRCLLYTSPSPRDVEESRMPSSA